MVPSALRSGHRLEKVVGVLLVNLATFTWATNMTLGRWLRNSIGPITLSASRFLIAAMLLSFLLRRQPKEERRLGQDRWLLVGMALSGVAVFAPTLYLGLRYTTTVNATMINGLGPLITGLLATLLIREPMSRRQLVGALIGLAGVLIVISGGSPAVWRSIQGNIGDLIVLGAMTLWGIYSVLGRRVMHHRSAISATALSTLLGLPLLLLAAAWEIRAVPVDWRPEVILAVVYIGMVPAVIGFLSWNEGVRRLGASGAMLFYNTLPLYGAFLGFVFLREPITIAHVVGGTLIIGGGVWAAVSGRT